MISININTTYKELLKYIRALGCEVQTHNSICQRSIGMMYTFDHAPLISARKTAWRTALREMEWFLSGSNNIHDAHESVRPWWEPWVEEDGRVLYNYGSQFGSFTGQNQRVVHQVTNLYRGIREHPYSRRNCLTTWNTADMTAPDCKITNCHNSFTQAFVEPGDILHLVTYQRSADVICGLPHNWIQMWAFLLWMAKCTHTTPGTLKWIGGDVHLYEAHYQLARKIIETAPCSSPGILYNGNGNEFRADDFALMGKYEPILTDKAAMIV